MLVQCFYSSSLGQESVKHEKRTKKSDSSAKIENFALKLQFSPLVIMR